VLEAATAPAVAKSTTPEKSTVLETMLRTSDPLSMGGRRKGFADREYPETATA
jgi:hypothetical protein